MEIVEKRNPLPWIIVVLLLVCVISLGFMLHQTQDKLSEAEFRILQLESEVYNLEQRPAGDTLNELVEEQEAEEESSNGGISRILRKYGYYSDTSGDYISPEGSPLAEDRYLTHEQQLAIENGQ